ALVLDELGRDRAQRPERRGIRAVRDQQDFGRDLERRHAIFGPGRDDRLREPLGLLLVGVRTSVGVLEAIEVLRLIGTFVLGADERVAIDVGVRATVLLRVGRARPLHVRAGILLVRDAVAVVVGVGTAVGVLEAVLVLRLVGALVADVGDAVAVA